MHIGTPLSPSATRVMVVGAGELGKELIISLQRLGVETIAVDRYANAPGHQVAHRAHVIAMSDGHALRRLIEQERPHFVVPEFDAVAVDALVALAQSAMCAVVPTARAVELTTSRDGIRRLAAESLALPTSPYRFAGSLDELKSAIAGDRRHKGIGYPCVVKPVTSWSGKGQSLVRTKDDVAAAWQAAASAGRANDSRVIVEGFVDFDYEVTLLTVRTQGPDGAIETRFCEPIGHLQANGDYVESWQPQPMSDVAHAKAREIASRITGELGGRGVFGIELFVKEDRVWFSEASPRPHDAGMVTMCTQAQSEFDLHARAILGLPVDTRLCATGASAVIYGGAELRAPRYENVERALAVPHSELRLFGKPEAHRRRRMGVALATGRDTAQARERARQCAACVVPAPG